MTQMYREGCQAEDSGMRKAKAKANASSQDRWPVSSRPWMGCGWIFASIGQT